MLIQANFEARLSRSVHSKSYRARAEAELVLVQRRLARTLSEADEAEAVRIREQIARDEQTARDIRRQSVLGHQAQEEEDELVARALETVSEDAGEEGTNGQLGRDTAAAGVLRAYLEEEGSSSTASSMRSYGANNLLDAPKPDDPSPFSGPIPRQGWQGPSSPTPTDQLAHDELVAREILRQSLYRHRRSRAAREQHDAELARKLQDEEAEAARASRSSQPAERPPPVPPLPQALRRPLPSPTVVTPPPPPPPPMNRDEEFAAYNAQVGYGPVSPTAPTAPTAPTRRRTRRAQPSSSSSHRHRVSPSDTTTSVRRQKSYDSNIVQIITPINQDP